MSNQFNNILNTPLFNGTDTSNKNKINIEKLIKRTKKQMSLIDKLLEKQKHDKKGNT